MKHAYLLKLLFIITLSFFAFTVKAQQNEELLNLLIQKKVVTQEEADSLRADLAIKAQDQKDKQAKFPLTIGKSLTLTGLLQTRYQSFQGTNTIDGFDVRRARLGLKGAITHDWDYELLVEFAGNPFLLDGYTTYKFADYLKVSVGQFKIPFSLESLSSDSQSELIDHSQVEEALTAHSKDVLGNQNGRGIGAQISGSFFKVNDNYLFDYAIGVFDGNGINKTDNNNNKDIAGRLTVHPVANLALSYNFYSGHASLGTPLVNQVRNRRGVDARYVYGPLSLTAEYDRGTDGIIDREGWYGQAAYYIFPKKLQVAVKYDTYDPTKTNSLDQTHWYVGGVNYFFNSWTKLAVDYTYKREQAPAQTLNNLLSAQLQVSF